MKLQGLLNHIMFILFGLLHVLHSSSSMPLKFKSMMDIEAGNVPQHSKPNYLADFSSRQQYTKKESYSFQSAYSILNQKKLLLTSVEPQLQVMKELQAMTCILCKGIVYLVQTQAAKGSTKEEIAKIITKVCIFFRIEDERVCIGIVSVFQVNIHIDRTAREHLVIELFK